MSSQSVHVLFVCLGNICRSPLAEALFLKHIQQLNLSDKVAADSCGTGNWHAGQLADPRTRKTAARYNLRMPHRARQIQTEDFSKFDHIFVMDQQNLKNVLSLPKAIESKVQMITDFHDQYLGQEVPDPYYGDESDFEYVHKMLDEITEKIALHLLQ